MGQKKTLVVEGGSWVDALHEAALTGLTILRVRTRRTRIISQPERVTGKSGDRIFGAERLRPKTTGWRVRRVFTLA